MAQSPLPLSPSHSASTLSFFTSFSPLPLGIIESSASLPSAERTSMFVADFLLKNEYCFINLPPSNPPSFAIYSVNQNLLQEIDRLATPQRREELAVKCFHSYQRFHFFDNPEEMLRSFMMEFALPNPGNYWVEEHVILNGERMSVVFLRDIENRLQIVQVPLGAASLWLESHADQCNINVRWEINKTNKYPVELGKRLVEQFGLKGSNCFEKAMSLNPMEYCVLYLPPTHHSLFPTIQVLLLKDQQETPRIHFFKSGNMAFLQLTDGYKEVISLV